MTRAPAAAALAIMLIAVPAAADDRVPAFLTDDSAAFAHLLPGQPIYLATGDQSERPIRGTGGAPYATVIDRGDGDRLVRLRVWDPVATLAFYVADSALDVVAVRETRLVVRPARVGDRGSDAPGIRIAAGDRLALSSAPSRSRTAIRVDYESADIVASGFVRRDDVGRIFESTRDRESERSADHRFVGTRFLDAPDGRELARIRNPEVGGVMVARIRGPLRRHMLVAYDNVVGWVAAAELSPEVGTAAAGGGSGWGVAGTGDPDVLPSGTLLHDDDGAVVGVLNAPVPVPDGDGDWRPLTLPLDIGDIVVRVKVPPRAKRH